MRPDPKRGATHEDLATLPQGQVGQLIAGELIALPRPANDHVQATSALGGELYGTFQRNRSSPGGWWLVDKPELHFGSDVLVPDLAGWRRTRMPVIPRTPSFTLVPNWVCEVLSPSTVELDRVRKKHIYAREGIEYVWLIDPAGRTLEAFQLQGGRWLQWGAWCDDDRVRAAPFDAMELELQVLWLPEQAPQP